MTVAAGGYVTTNELHGYAWTATDYQGSTIVPADYSAQPAGEPLCASGTVAGAPEYTGIAMVGFNLNQEPTGGTGSELSWSPAGDGIMYSLVLDTSTPVHLALHGPTQTWCAVVTEPDGLIPWDNFNTACWDNSGSSYDRSPLQSVSVNVTGDVASHDYRLCIQALGVGSWLLL